MVGASERIVTKLVPEWITHQLDKSRDYNSETDGAVFENADILGVQGQFADIWRKIWKLKKALWDGSKLTAEQPREILMDLIGHCFLAIDMIDRQAGGEEETEAAFELPARLGKTPACGVACQPKRHTFIGPCRYRIADWTDVSDIP